MKIVNISLNYDPACAGELLSRVINKNTDHVCRYIIGDYTRFPAGSKFNESSDIVFFDKFNINEVHQILREADVLHFNQYDWTTKWEDLYWISSRKSLYPKEELPAIDWKSYLSGKVVVWHGHGGAWLLNPEKQMKICRDVGAVPITCSPIDEKVAPGLVWMPNPLSTESSYLKPKERNWDGELLGGMASVAGDYKGKVIAEYVFEYVNKAGYPVKFDYITQKTRRESLEQRKNWHITIDNWTQGFFGLAGLEGLALGHITIARLDPLARERWDSMFKYDPVPVVDVKGMDECGKVLRDLCNDRALAKWMSVKSSMWIQNNYSEKKMADRWIKFYESCPVAHGGKKNISMSTNSVDTREAIKTSEKESKVFSVRPVFEEISTVEDLVKREKEEKVILAPIVENERGTVIEILPDTPAIDKIEKDYPVYHNYVHDQFDQTGDLKKPLDRIMGNESKNDYELDMIKKVMMERVNFKDKTRVMDAGCGIGRLFPVYKELGFKEVVGMDYSTWMVEQCRKKYPDSKIYNTDLEAMFAFPENSVNVAVAMYVFIHILDDDKLTRTINAMEHAAKDLIIIGQVMDPEHLISTEFCKVREVYDLYKRFKTFKMKNFFKDYYSVKADDGSWENKISFLVMSKV